MSQRPGQESQVVLEPRAKRRLQRPRLYKVLLHNDDFTTMEFVVAILMRIFHLSEADATAVMLHVHHHGIGVAGIYPFEIAETKVAEVTRAAEEAEYPLLCTLEADDDPDEDGGEPGPDGAAGGGLSQ